MSDHRSQYSQQSSPQRFAHIVFLMDDLPDQATLIAAVSGQAEIQRLDASGNALEQLARHLAQRSGLQTIHLFSHGRPGVLQLGSLTLSHANLEQYADELATIGTALGGSGDLILYGCETGKGICGRAFVQALTAATGTQVVAARRKVGAASLGGDWSLDVGTPRYGKPFAIPQWQGVLSAWVAFSDPKTFTGLNGIELVYDETMDLTGGGTTTISLYDASNALLGTFVPGSGFSLTNSDSADSIDDGDAFNLIVADVMFPSSGTTLSLSSSTVLAEGDYYFQISSTGGGYILDSSMAAAQDISDTTTLDFSIDHVPYVSANSITSNAGADNTYAAGDVVSVSVTFSETVTVDTSGGTPTLNIKIGSSQKAASYQSGSGGNTLVFQYTIQSGDNDTNGISIDAGTDIVLHGGTITDSGGNSLNPQVIDFSDQASHKVDALAPTVTNLTSSTANGSYKAGDVISISVVFSEAVTVDSSSGSPTLTLETGTTDRSASYVSGSGSNTLVFSYTVQAGDSASDLDYHDTAALALNGSTIKDAVLNNATLTLASPAANHSLGYNKDLVIDTAAPTLSSSTPADNASGVNAGSNISLVFNETIQAGSGNITISDGGSDTRTISVTDATQVSVSGNTLTINPTADLNSGSSYHVQVASTAILDAAGNAYAGIANTTSLNFSVSSPNHAPSFSNLGGGGASYTPGAAAVILDEDVTVSDPDLTGGNYSGASLTLTHNGGANSADVFGATGGLSLNAGNVILSGTTIGSYTNSNGTFSITFNGNATQSRVDATLQSLTFSRSAASSSDTADNGSIVWIFNDGNTGGAQGTGGALSASGSTDLQITGHVNQAPTGSVGIKLNDKSVTGQALKSGQTLVADTSTLADADGLGTLHYEWQAAGVKVGSDQNSYKLTAADAGKTIKLVVSYTDGYAYKESITSDPTSAVATSNHIGWTKNSFDRGIVTATKNIVLQGEKIYVSGISGDSSQQVLACYSSDGSLDTSFSEDGWLNANGDGSKVASLGLAALTVGGKADVILADTVNSSTFVLKCYGADGSAEIGFNGTGNSSSVTNVSAIATQADKLLVAGVDKDGQLFLSRYGSDGQLDKSFGSVYKVPEESITLSLKGVTNIATHDGKILVAVQASDGVRPAEFLLHFDANGKVDSSYGAAMINGSSVSKDSFAVQQDGQILVASTYYDQGWLARYDGNGNPDSIFGDSGAVQFNIVGGNLASSDSTVTSIALDGERIVLAYTSHGWLGLSRYNKDGKLDTTFSGDGKLLFKANDLATTGASITVQADHKILVAGSIGGQFGLMRFNEDGSLDLSFGDAGSGNNQPTDSGSITEDTALVTVSAADGVLANDTGTNKLVTALNGQAITASSPQTFAGCYGSLTLNADGSYSYQLDNTLAGVQALGAGSSVTDSFGYSMKAGDLPGYGTLEISITGTNDAPVANGIIGLTTEAGKAFGYTIDSAAFSDVDEGDTLTYAVEQVDATGAVVGSGSLPSGMSFDAATRSLIWTEVLAAGNYWFKLTASDAQGASASDIFAIEVKAGVAANTKGTFQGSDGDELLSGTDGDDKMTGGKDDDTYQVNSAGDKVSEKPDEGNDTVEASISYRLGKNVENLKLMGSATDNLQGAGNALSNVIYGDAGNNLLDGGKDVDTFYGGAGDDVYVLDFWAEADTVHENHDEGNDTIQLDLNGAGGGSSFTLGDNIENLELTGSAFIRLIGNTLDNTITGNSKANALDGNDGNDTLDGGKGIDTLTGGTGNDTYYVDAGSKLDKAGNVKKAGDSVIEAADGGTDTVHCTAASYTLADNVENLILDQAGQGTGNALDNWMRGSDKADKLNGAAGADTINGGLGNDMLTGGDGNDTFAFTTAPDTDNVDSITDFVSGADKISLSSDIFSALPTYGTDLSTYFLAAADVLHATGISATTCLLYDTQSGALYYDADGSGTTESAIQIASLVNADKTTPTLAGTDLFVI